MIYKSINPLNNKLLFEIPCHTDNQILQKLHKAFERYKINRKEGP